MEDELPDPSRAKSNPSADSGRDPSLPSHIGTYRILRLLGEGGMGVVYEAEQQRPRRLVALKVIRGGRVVDESTIRMFQREADALARLKHPGIAAIYESGRTEDDQHYFAMELVPGQTLTEWIQGRKSEAPSREEVRRRLAVFHKICDAVTYAHQRGVIHRDLKPGNILIVSPEMPTSTSGAHSVPSVKILDFGLARITDVDVAMATQTIEIGRIAGTLPYMSPEQVRGNPDGIDFRSDIYALGVILYELLTGELPYDLQRAAIHEAIRIICEQPPRPLPRMRSGAQRPDAEIETILRRILEKEPARRYQTVASLTEDIDRYLAGQPILARPPSALYTLRKLVQRHKLGFSAAALFVVLLIGFTVVLAIQSHRLAVERDRAVLEARRVRLEADGFYAAFRGDYPGAATMLRQALILHRKALGNDNLELAPHLYTLGGYLEMFGETGMFANAGRPLAEMTALYREALEIRRRHLPPNDPLVVESILILAGAMELQEGYADSTEALYREAIRGRMAFPEGDSLRGVARAGLANSVGLRALHALRPGGVENTGGLPPFVRLDRDLPELIADAVEGSPGLLRAEPFLRERLSLVRATDGAPSPLMECEAELGTCLARLGHYAEAESLLQESYDIAKTVRQPPNRPVERAALERMVLLYDASGQREMAQRYRAKIAMLDARGRRHVTPR